MMAFLFGPCDGGSHIFATHQGQLLVEHKYSGCTRSGTPGGHCRSGRQRGGTLTQLLIMVMVLGLSACRSSEEPRPAMSGRPESEQAATISKDDVVDPHSLASDAAASGVRALETGDASRAVDQFGRAAKILEGVSGEERQRASHLLSTGLALATLGRHKEAVVQLKGANDLLSRLGRQDSTSAMAQSCLHREQVLLAVHAEFRSVATRPDTAPPRRQVLLLGRALLNDYGFRKSFLMDNAAPVAFPDQIAALLEIDSLELHSLCAYAFRVHQHYHELLQGKYPLMMGAVIHLSRRVEEILFDQGAKGDADLRLRIEERLGTQPSVDM